MSEQPEADREASGAAGKPRRAFGFPLLLVVLLMVVGSVVGHGIRKSPGGEERPADGEALMTAHCGVCHLVPGPDAMPETAWRQFLDRKVAVMRKHAAKLGLPESAMPTPEQLAAIRAYILKEALTQELLAPRPQVRLQPVDWLEATASRPPQRDAAMGGYIGTWVDTATRTVLLSNVGRGRLEATDFQGRAIGEVPVGITPARIESGRLGLLVPLMEDPEGGKVVRIRFDRAHPERSTVEEILTGLERPIRAYSGVLKGREGIFVEEFGFDHGGLRFWPESPSGSFEAPETVIDASGIVGSAMVDLDGDGIRDLVALISQEAEQLVIYPGAARAAAGPVQIFKGHPGYGFVGLTIADVDGDGRPDILTANGDNYDLASGPLKPYHGIRIFHNEGDLRFSDPLFLPFHGIVKVLARDFDLDGDVDLLALSAFPDYRMLPYESAVVFEQNDAHRFIPRAIEAASGSRWIDAVAPDLDGDADDDLVLIGAYSTVTDADRRWSDLAGPDPKTLLFLRNLTRR